MSSEITVRLGARDYRLVPQRIGRISRKLEQAFELFGSGVSSTPDEVTGTFYEVLQVFIPDLAPRWEMAGYASEDAFMAKKRHDEEVERLREQHAVSVAGEGARWAELDAAQQVGFTPPSFVDPYDDAADRSPTPPEIADAVQAIFEIHGGDRFTGLLGKFLSPETVKRMIHRYLLESSLRRSQRLQLQSGESASASSTPTSPTSESSEESPLSDSSGGSAPELGAVEATTSPSA